MQKNNFDTRLYRLDYDKEMWEVKGYLNGRYIITNRITKETFPILDDVIGIEQLDYNTFLIHQRVKGKKFQLARYKINGHCVAIEFKKIFKSFEFISDDKIKFDDGLIYTISDNSEFQKAKVIPLKTKDRS